MITTDLVSTVRKAWFCGAPSVVIGAPWVEEFEVSRELIWHYGGPRRYTSCETCQAMEWRSRLERKNLFKNHKCFHPSRMKHTSAFCKRAAHHDWVSTLKCYDFTIGTGDGLPGMKCLVAWPGRFYQRLMDPKADRGLIEFRQRLAFCQIAFWRGGKVPNYRDYDFVFTLCHPEAIKFSRKKRPKILVYCHDHHKLMDERQAFLNRCPHAIFTPYPTIWKSYYKIPKDTEVVFTPFISDTFFTRPDTNYTSRELDVLAVGATNSRVYPDRFHLAQIISRVPNKKWVAQTAAHSSMPYRNGCSIVGKSIFLNRWSQFLASSKIVTFAADKWGYLVRKYTEILGSGSLMVCHAIPDMALLGLREGHHYIGLPRPVTNEVVGMFQHILKNWSRYEPIALRGLKWQRDKSDWWLFTKFQKDVERICGL